MLIETCFFRLKPIPSLEKEGIFYALIYNGLIIVIFIMCF